MTTFRLRILCLLACCHIVAVSMSQTIPPNACNYNELLEVLENRVALADKRALRDLGSLIENKTFKKDVSQIISDYSLFTKKEFDLNNTPIERQQWLDFYYKNEQKIKFSYILGSFFITPIEERTCDFEIRPYKKTTSKDNVNLLIDYIHHINEDFELGASDDILCLISEISTLTNPEAGEYLKTLLQSKLLATSTIPHKNIIYQGICKALENYPNLENIQTIIKLVEEKYVSPIFIAPILTNMTNINVIKNPKNEAEYDSLTSKYHFYIDSLKNLEAMRAWGYQQYSRISVTYFKFSVDYYGALLSTSDYTWVRHNAMRDLLASKHPRALFYIAAQCYKYRQHLTFDDHRFVEMINRITNLEIAVRNKNNDLSYYWQYNDVEAKLNYTIYWANHYDDYEWEDSRQAFVNKKSIQENAKNYETLIRNLSTKDDSLALASFQQLSEGSPAEVLSLMEKYRSLLRSVNPKLPSFNAQFIDQLVRLTDYCRNNAILYKPFPSIKLLLKKMSLSNTPTERYSIENTIIENLTFDDITAIEYWACLREQNIEDSYSASRIIDRFYTNNWEGLIGDDQQLRLYLKKSYLFSNIGTIGACNTYLNKFNPINIATQKRLKELKTTESDKDIIKQINRLVEQPEQSEILENFITAPIAFDKNNISHLAAPTSEDYRRIVHRLHQEWEENEATNRIFDYLELYKSPEQVPFLFELSKDHLFSEKIVNLLENIYQFSFVTNEQTSIAQTLGNWQQQWDKEGKTFREWDRSFLERQLERIKSSPILSIDDLNRAFASKHFKPQYRQICLQALTKVRPYEDIARLKTAKLSFEKDWQYVEKIPLNYKNLDKLAHIFDLSNRIELVLEKFEMKARKYTLAEKGVFYNNLFRLDWFTSQLNKGKISAAQINNIKTILNTYLNENELITEFEEQNTIIHIAELNSIGKSPIEQLEASLALDIDPNTRASLQENILSHISYPDLAQIAPYINRLTTKQGASPFHFLNKDFGLPIFEFKNFDAEKEFIQKHRQLSEYQFYTYYLKNFGVDFLNEQQELDFNKIYSLLKYDIVAPFVGGNGSRRDFYTYGIIKLLELKFNTRLGFHEKLNENQTFVAYNSSKRAQAWINYLVEQGMVRLENYPPSLRACLKIYTIILQYFQN